eukprot:832406-Ditylum_brightwellii.AAC.1
MKAANIVRRENDGDTWVEAKAILDEETGETRSYFWSVKSKRRTWDRPPRNAGKVIYWTQIAKHNTENEKVPQKIAVHKGSKKAQQKTVQGRRRSDPLPVPAPIMSITPITTRSTTPNSTRSARSSPTKSITSTPISSTTPSPTRCITPPDHVLSTSIPIRRRTCPPTKSAGSGS